MPVRIHQPPPTIRATTAAAVRSLPSALKPTRVSVTYLPDDASISVKSPPRTLAWRAGRGYPEGARRLRTIHSTIATIPIDTAMAIAARLAKVTVQTCLTGRYEV